MRTFPQRDPSFAAKPADLLHHAPHSICASNWNDIVWARTLLHHILPHNISALIRGTRSGITRRTRVEWVCEIGLFTGVIVAYLQKNGRSVGTDRIEKWVNTEHTSSATSSVAGSVSSICSASLGTHCTCKRHFPTSHGIAMAVVVYPSAAVAMSVLRRRPKSSPPGSASPGESSKIEFCTGREEKV